MFGIVGRGLAVRATLSPELTVEIFEELRRCPNDSSFGRHRAADSVRAIRSPMRARARASSSGGIFSMSVTTLASNSASCSDGGSVPSFFAVQIVLRSTVTRS